MSPRRRLSWTLLILSVACAATATARADEIPTPGPAIAHFEIQGISHLDSHPLTQRIAKWVSETQFFEPFRTRPNVRAADEAIQVLESRLGISRRELLIQLTAGGVTGVVQAGDPPRLVVITESVDPDLPGRLLRAVDELVAQSGQQAALEKTVHGTFETRKLGGLHIAVADRRLLLSGDRETLTSTLDALPAPAANTKRDENSGEFQARVSVDLQAVRNAAGGGEGLEFPAKDAGGVAILGGWIDLLRSYDRATFELSLKAAELELKVRTSEPSGPLVTPGLEGFWGAADQSPLPLLTPPGTLYSTSWRRDYAALWKARETLLIPEVAATLSKGDADAGQQMQVVGATFTPSELISQLGPHFRVVLLQGSAPYDEVAPPNVLPAAVAAVELRDESLVRKWSGPVLRILNLILNGDQGIVSTTEQHGDATLTILSLPTTPQALRKRSLDRFNFRTTYTFAFGHFVIGTTPAAVRAVLDELGSASQEPKSDDGLQVAERQLLEAGRAAEVLESLREAVLRGFVLNLGWTSDEATREYAALGRLLTGLGTLNSEAGFTESGFEYRIHWRMPDAGRPGVSVR